MDRDGADWRALEHIGAKRGQSGSKMDKNVERVVGGKRRKKMDKKVERKVDGKERKRMEAGGSGTGAKKDTSTARWAR